MKIWTWLAVLNFVACAQVISFGIVISDDTDDDFVKSLYEQLPGFALQLQIEYNLPYGIQSKIVTLSTQSSLDNLIFPPEFLELNVILIFDCTQSVHLSHYLAYQAIQRDLVHIVVKRPLDLLHYEKVGPRSLFLELDFNTQAFAFIELIQMYGWTNLALVYNQDSRNIQLANVFKEQYPYPEHIHDEVLLNSNDYDNSSQLNLRLESTTKESGARVILVFTDNVLAAQLLYAGDQSVMGGQGFIWMLNSSAMSYLDSISKHSHADISEVNFGVLKTGTIGLIGQINESQLQLMRRMMSTTLQYYISQNFELLGHDAVRGESAFDYLIQNSDLYFKDQVRYTDYDIYNIVEFKSYNVGYVSAGDHQVHLYETTQIIWPGFTSETPDDNVPLMTIALLYPASFPNGADYEPGAEIKNAFDLAVQEINQSFFISPYQLLTKHVDTKFSEQQAGSNIKSLSNANIIWYIGALMSKETEAYHDALANYLDPKPMVSYGVSSVKYSDSVQYQDFLRVIQADSLQSTAIATVIQEFGWNKIAVIYTTNQYGNGLYQSLEQNLSQIGVTIENDEEYRGIDAPDNEEGSQIVISSSTLDSIDDALDEIVRNQLKVIIYLGDIYVGAQMAIKAQEKELTGEEYAWIGGMWLTEEMLNWIDSEHSADKSAILEVLNGAIGIGEVGIVGDVGTTFAEAYTAQYETSPSTKSMYAYDAVYTFANAIQSMISRGEDFNSGRKLTDGLRKADFVGASGNILFGSSTNDRAASGYAVVNMQDGQIVRIANFDPRATVLYVQTSNDVVWGDGGSSVPDDEWDQEYD